MRLFIQHSSDSKKVHIYIITDFKNRYFFLNRLPNFIAWLGYNFEWFVQTLFCFIVLLLVIVCFALKMCLTSHWQIIFSIRVHCWCWKYHLVKSNRKCPNYWSSALHCITCFFVHRKFLKRFFFKLFTLEYQTLSVDVYSFNDHFYYKFLYKKIT